MQQSRTNVTAAVLLLPATPKGAVEIDLRQQQRVFHRHNIQLGAEQRALRIKLIEIGRIAILITVARNPPRLGNVALLRLLLC